MLAEEKIVCSKEHGGYTQKQPTHMPDMTQKNSTTPIYYRSRDPSPSLSPVPYLDNSLTDESEDISPPSLAGRKLRSSSELAQLPGSRITTRSVKRPRYVFALFVFAFTNPTLASLLRWSTLVCHPRRRAQKKRQKMIPPIRHRVSQGPRNSEISIPTNNAWLVHM